MIVGTYFERKFKHRREQELAAARAEERKRTVAEFNALIDEWEKRRDEATEKGEPFDEPPPMMKE